MSNRYGRHGPRAWFRQRQRRYARTSLLPVPVTPPTVIRVFVPMDIGKVIFIIMPENREYNLELDESGRLLRSTGNMSVETTNSSGPLLSTTINTDGRGEADESIVNQAKWQASEDVPVVENLIKEGNFVFINQAGIERIINNLVTNHLRQIKERHENPPTSTQRRELYRLYHEEYQKSFREYSDPGLLNSRSFYDPQELEIYKAAMDDRENVPADKRNYHIRDMAVIRILQIFHVYLEDAVDKLPELHKFIDHYSEYYSSGRKAVFWPSQETFRD